MADSQYEVESKTALSAEVLSKLQQYLLMLWMISKAEDKNPVGPGV